MNKWRTVSFACLPGIIGFAAYALSRPHAHADEVVVRARRTSARARAAGRRFAAAARLSGCSLSRWRCSHRGGGQRGAGDAEQAVGATRATLTQRRHCLLAVSSVFSYASWLPFSQPYSYMRLRNKPWCAGRHSLAPIFLIII